MGIKYKDTGHIDVEVAGELITLRPPKLGEYRELRQPVLDAASREGSSNLDEAEAEKVLADFMRETFVKLGKPLPDDEGEWPTWLPTAAAYRGFIAHWRKVPLGLG